MVVGTSAIYMGSTRTPKKITGAWGPSPSLINGYAHHVVGQTTVGALIDHITGSHPAYQSACQTAKRQRLSLSDYLNQQLYKMAQQKDLPVAELTANIHIQPYFSGNRTPWMDSRLTGAIVGCTLDSSEDHLALFYLATIQALAMEAKQNLDTLTAGGYNINQLMPADGLINNKLFMQEHINALNTSAVLPDVCDPMRVAGAITAAVATRFYDSVTTAMQSMASYTKELHPKKSSLPLYEKSTASF